MVVAAAATVWADLAVEALGAAESLAVELMMLVLEVLAIGHSLVELAAAAIVLALVAPTEVSQKLGTSNQIL